MNKHVLKEYGI